MTVKDTGQTKNNNNFVPCNYASYNDLISQHRYNR